MFLLPFVPGCQLENANYLAESTKAFLVIYLITREVTASTDQLHLLLLYFDIYLELTFSATWKMLKNLLYESSA